MKKVLIVEELRPILEMEQSILKRSGLRLFTASSGEEALRIHKAEKTNLIITALELKDLPGDELCRLIRADDELKHVSIIMVCNKKKADIARCASSGANTYITKPINYNELREAVDKLIDVPYRRNLRVLIKAEVKSHFRNEPFFCTSENISRSGLLLETEKILAKGDQIRCSFFIPEEEKIDAECEVVRIEKKREHTFHYGVRFTSISEEYLSAIDRFVQRRLKTIIPSN